MWNPTNLSRIDRRRMIQLTLDNCWATGQHPTAGERCRSFYDTVKIPYNVGFPVDLDQGPNRDSEQLTDIGIRRGPLLQITRVSATPYEWGCNNTALSNLREPPA